MLLYASELAAIVNRMAGQYKQKETGIELSGIGCRKPGGDCYVRADGQD
jgi:hypothetical protein